MPDATAAPPNRLTTHRCLLERAAGTREELMDTATSAAPDEKAPSPESAARQPGKEKPDHSGPPEISAAISRLTSNSIDELHKLVSELQKMQDFLKSEVESVQRQIDSAVAGINIIVDTIGPWKSIAGSSGTRNVRAGGPAANIEQRIRGG
jgi:hypothetical protein